MKITYLPFQPHCFAFGGFEIQMLNNLKAISDLGLDVKKMDYWDRKDDFDIMHCWGLGFPHFENIKWGKQKNKKVVASILLYDYDSFIKRVKFKVSSYISVQKYLIEMLAQVDAVSVVNTIQAETCHKLYKVPEAKIWVIPNVVDDKYFLHTPTVNNNSVFLDYVLIVGNVSSRKNQVSLAKACIKTNRKLMIIGKVMDGENEYGNELQLLVNQHENIRWIKGLEENTDELLDYYLGASLIALPSFVEQQPLSLLEGAILGKPLLIADRAYAKQNLYSRARLVDPTSIDSISDGISDVLQTPQQYCQSLVDMETCKAENVAIQYNALYQSLIY